MPADNRNGVPFGSGLSRHNSLEPSPPAAIPISPLTRRRTLSLSLPGRTGEAGLFGPSPISLASYTGSAASKSPPSAGPSPSSPFFGFFAARSPKTAPVWGFSSSPTKSATFPRVGALRSHPNVPERTESPIGERLLSGQLLD